MKVPQRLVITLLLFGCLAATARAQPKITTSSPLPSGAVGQPYNVQLQAQGTGTPFTWLLWDSTLPPGLHLTGGGLITGTPTSSGQYGFTVRVYDNTQTYYDAKNLAIYVAPAPLEIVTSSPLPGGTIGEQYNVQFQATGGMTPFEWEIIAGAFPPGIGWVDSGTIGGTPTTFGDYPFTVRVRDYNYSEDEKQFLLKVRDPLKITAPTDLPPGMVNQNYSVDLIADGGEPPYVWTVFEGTLAPGITLSPGGKLRGLPTTADKYIVRFQVTDAGGRTDVRGYIFDIRPGLEIVTTSPLPDGALQVAYETTLEATGGTEPYAWRVIEGNLPNGLRLGNDGRIAGIPAAAGVFVFVARVIDGGERTVDRAFQITIVGGLTISTTSPLPDGTVGAAYQTSLQAAGGEEPYTWSIVEGALPPGLTLSQSGTISGTPTQVGNYIAQISVIDAAEDTDSRVFDLTVSLAALSITTSSLPDGTVGAAYETSLQAAGGSPPYTWSIIEGALPPGLTLSQGGTISGTPTQAGDHIVQISVMDAAENTVSRVFDLTISQTALSITTSSLPDGVVGVAYQQSLQAAGGSPPYSWERAGGALPSGLSIGGDGVISGTPAETGTFQFTAQVFDQQMASATRDLTLTIAAPPVAGITIEGLPGQAEPAQQLNFNVMLSEPYTLPLTGEATLTFTPDSSLANPAVDGSVQFLTGGNTVQFNVPAGSTNAVFPEDPMAVQSGSVAGEIRITARISRGGVDVTPEPAPVQVIIVPRSAPRIDSFTLTRTAGGFQARITGMSTPRDMTQAVFQFTQAAGESLQTTQLTVQVGSAFTNWYQNANSAAFGSTFVYTQPFTISGSSNAVSSVTVRLTNSAGESQSASAGF